MSQAIPELGFPEEPDAKALGAAADAVRRLIAHVRKTRAPRELLESIAKDVDGLADRLEGRKIFIRGTMHHGDTLCSEAEGLFIQPKTSVVEAALEKFASRATGPSTNPAR